MVKTAAGSLSRDLEFEIIGDYTHPSPFQIKRRNLFNPPLWCSFAGCPGTAGLHHRPKKKTHITYGTRRSAGPSLQGWRPVGQWTRGAGSYWAEGHATWPQITAVSGETVGLPACMGSSHGKREEGAWSWVLTLDSELQTSHCDLLFPTTSLLSWIAPTDSSQSCRFTLITFPKAFCYICSTESLRV